MKTCIDNSSFGNLIYSYVDGYNWLELYSNGKCRQGGFVEVSGTAGTKNVTLLKEMASTDYSILTTDTQSTVGNGGSAIKQSTIAVDSFDFFWTSKALTGFFWEVEGKFS